MENVTNPELTLQFELMEEVIAPGAMHDFLSGVTDGAAAAGAAAGAIALVALT
ncbi:hypothetical protein [Bacillus cereus group sp. MYBK217-2]|uniref:hypothetical protein n=1 Tax=Bacillus cereus group sp. MYBK217-2 TaxID=3450661 RepID=UPI003F7A3E83